MNSCLATSVGTLTRTVAYVGICAACCQHSLTAAQADVVRRIGYITFDSAAAHRPYADAFRQGLRKNGLIEGRNLAIEWRYAEYSTAALSRLVTELIEKKVWYGPDIMGLFRRAGTYVARILRGTSPADRWSSRRSSRSSSTREPQALWGS